MLRFISILTVFFLVQLSAEAAQYHSLANWQSNQSVNGKWSTTQGGNSCNCTPNFSTDTIYVYHNITLKNGLTSNSGGVYVANGGRLVVGNWSGSFIVGSNSFLHIADGGQVISDFGFQNSSDSVKLFGELNIRNGNIVQNSGNISVEGTGAFKTQKTWSTHTLQNTGSFTAKEGSTLRIGSITNSGSMHVNTALTTTNYSNLTNTGLFTIGSKGVMSAGHVTNQSNGTIEVYGDLKLQKRWNNLVNHGNILDNGYIQAGNLTNNGQINGIGIITWKGYTMSNNGTINGCGSCSFSKPTYLAGVPGNGNVKIYRSDSWVNGVPTQGWDAIFLSDYAENYNVYCNNVTIASNVTVTIASGKNLVVDNAIHNDGVIHISDKASLVQKSSASNTGTGSYKVERNTGILIDDTRYQYWSSPMQNATMGDVFVGSNTTDFYFYDESIQNWSSQSSSSVMIPGRGYITTGSIGISHASETRVFEGQVNNGNVSLQVTAGVGDHILVGNPYPSAIRCQDFINDNAGIAGAIYLWDHHTAQAGGSNTSTDYGTWTAMGATSGNSNEKPDDYIVVGQGIFVESGAVNPTITFKNDYRVEGNNNKFFSQGVDERKRMWLNITNENNDFNQVLIGFVSDATDGFDRLFDAKKLKAHPAISFYSMVGNQEVSIQGLPHLSLGETKVIQLGVDAWTTGEHTISLDSLHNWPANYKAFLVDSEENTRVLLGKDIEYTFTVDSTGIISDRFSVVINHKLTAIDPGFSDDISPSTTDTIHQDSAVGDPTGIVSIEDLDMTIFNSQGYIHIQGSIEVNKLQILDMNGRLVLEENIQSTNYSLPFVNKGVYIVNVELANGKVATKKIYSHY